MAPGSPTRTGWLNSGPIHPDVGGPLRLEVKCRRSGASPGRGSRRSVPLARGHARRADARGARPRRRRWPRRRSPWRRRRRRPLRAFPGPRPARRRVGQAARTRTAAGAAEHADDAVGCGLPRAVGPGPRLRPPGPGAGNAGLTAGPGCAGLTVGAACAGRTRWLDPYTSSPRATRRLTDLAHRRRPPTWSGQAAGRWPEASPGGIPGRRTKLRIALLLTQRIHATRSFSYVFQLSMVG